MEERGKKAPTHLSDRDAVNNVTPRRLQSKLHFLSGVPNDGKHFLSTGQRAFLSVAEFVSDACINYHLKSPVGLFSAVVNDFFVGPGSCNFHPIVNCIVSASLEECLLPTTVSEMNSV